jgi:uncharacterized protein (TIGR03663 family)
VASAQKGEHAEEWHLGVEPGDEHDGYHVHQLGIAEHPAALARDRSRERLERPLHVVTPEHLGWVAIAIYAGLTRLVALGTRPLDPSEARHALYAFDVASTGTDAAAGYYPAYAGWVHWLTASVFGIAGANDFTSRLVFALSGLLLIAMAFELRGYIGRAGGLALAAMLALSPSVTWFSRASATATPAATMTLVTLAAFMALKSRPTKRRAARLGICAGLMIATNPVGLVNGIIFIASLFLLGLWNLGTRKNIGLAMRVWLDRYSKLLVTVIVTTVVAIAASQWLLPDGWNITEIGPGFRMLLGVGGHSETPASLHLRLASVGFYLPVLTLYEFAIVIAGLVGAIAVITARIRSRFATWCLIWTILSLAFWFWTPTHSGESILAILLPAAMVGAIGIEWLHHLDAWRLIRLPIAILAALTLYVSVIANFFCAAPDASEAAWARHANLFWGANATTEQARLYARQASAGISPVNATVFFDDDAPDPLRWYLRDLRPVDDATVARVLVKTSTPPSGESQTTAIYHVDYAEGWSPNFSAAKSAEVARFMLSGRVWGPITTKNLTILVRKPSASAPTVILTPPQ